MTGAKKVISLAAGEIGYLEKKSNSQLDDKTANAGSGNYTKYARDLDEIGTLFNGRKNGYDWCAVFVTWCYVRSFGPDMAQKLLCQQQKGLAAGVKFAAEYFMKRNQFHTTGPQPGDQIFYCGKDPSHWQHTGLVEKVEGGRVYTIEGNTSRASGVVPNGGGVARKSYPLDHPRIAGYGRPDWSLVDGAASETKRPDPPPHTGPKPVDPSPAGPITEKKASAPAMSHDSGLAGEYTVTAHALHVRDNAGADAPILTIIPQGTTVSCYGYYTMTDGVKWLYVQVDLNGILYTGFADSEYLKKE